LRKEEKLGEDERLTYDQDEPSLEFFDASGFDEEDEQHIMGYYTGIRCVISELFVDIPRRSVTFSQQLAFLNISEDSIFSIQLWLSHQLTEQEKTFIEPWSDLLQSRTPTKLLDNNFEFNEEREEATEEMMLSDSNIEEETRRTNFVQRELEEAIRALDLAEAAENQWKEGDIELRLRILSAKRQTLKAIALLNKRVDMWLSTE
jgi:hypothetical protein